MNQAFEVKRNDLGVTRTVTDAVPDPGPGEAVLRVDAFALTANNITYGVAGDSIGYWKFFPAEGDWGRIPVWGFGDVVASHADGLAEGERFYGYFPMASHLKVRPERVAPHGFTDGVAHRAELPPVYNNYSRTSADPGYQADHEAMQMLFRPLFTTSFFLDDFLADNGFFGAQTVVLTSASSKTAFGLAWMLHRLRRDDVQVVGLTSPGNVAFCEGLGCYDRVVAYDDVGSLPVAPTVVVDMAGNVGLRSTLHHHFTDALKYSCSVGATHWGEAQIGGNAELPGPKPTMFFAPSQIQKRSAEWGGGDAVNTRIAEAWTPFVAEAQGWISVQEGTGAEAVEAVYAEVLRNEAKPSDGFILRL